ncbi:diguanylate cyclase [Lusitaniella coriacea]|uniref:GGDEF domain-containing protein n=1 Tax=Lusitaniella coriacea TaxID=1983105 RepID=UPI003CF0A527
MNSNFINILLVEDNLGDIFLIREMLKQTHTTDFELMSVSRLEEAIQCIHENSFGIILLDLSLPDSQGLDTFLNLASYASRIPTVVLTGSKDETLAIETVRHGAQDYLVKEQVSAEVLIRSIRYALERAQLLEKLRQNEERLQQFNRELKERVEERTIELSEKNEQLKNLLKRSMTDHLTGIANRYSVAELLEREWKNALRNAMPLSIIMMDIDFFKPYNDTYGHPQGDECLKQVAHSIQQTLKRPKDLVARYGGEEFLAILPDTDRAGAMVVVRQIQADIWVLNLFHPASPIRDRITLSFGVATIIPEGKTQSTTLIAMADKALYLAKQRGRDRIEYNEPNA